MLANMTDEDKSFIDDLARTGHHFTMKVPGEEHVFTLKIAFMPPSKGEAIKTAMFYLVNGDPKGGVYMKGPVKQILGLGYICRTMAENTESLYEQFHGNDIEQNDISENEGTKKLADEANNVSDFELSTFYRTERQLQSLGYRDF